MKLEMYERLKPYEEYFRQARKDYMRVPSTKYRELAELYAEHFGKRLTPGEMSCGRCQLRALKQLAEDYYKFQDSPYYKGLLAKQQEKDNGQSESVENTETSE